MGHRAGRRVRRTSLRVIRISPRPGRPSLGWLFAGPLTIPVALGCSGIRADKREGDGGTPRGSSHPLRLWWRADRLIHPRTFLPVRRIGAADAWCEDPADRRYNRPLGRSATELGDRLRRTDHLYDLIVEVDHNTRPRVSGRGSAVFIHLARDSYGPTAGCIGLSSHDRKLLVARITPKTRIKIHY